MANEYKNGKNHNRKTYANEGNNQLPLFLYLYMLLFVFVCRFQVIRFLMIYIV